MPAKKTIEKVHKLLIYLKIKLRKPTRANLVALFSKREVPREYIKVLKLKKIIARTGIGTRGPSSYYWIKNNTPSKKLAIELIEGFNQVRVVRSKKTRINKKRHEISILMELSDVKKMLRKIIANTTPR